MSRIHYAFNPKTGEWIFGSSLSSPTAVQVMLEKANLEGFQASSVDVMDSGWRMVKAAIDNRNNITQVAYFAEQVEGANREAKLESEAQEEQELAARALKAKAIEQERIDAAIKAKEQAAKNATVVKGGQERQANPKLDPAFDPANYVTDIPDGDRRAEVRGPEEKVIDQSIVSEANLPTQAEHAATAKQSVAEKLAAIKAKSAASKSP